MSPHTPVEAAPSTVNLFACRDVAAILHERAWLEPLRDADTDALLASWCTPAADLLGLHAADRAALAGLLSLVFSYDAHALLREATNQTVLAREGAREVVRELANRVLDGGDVDSDRFKEIIDGMKAALPHRGRSLFFPIRLALAGRVGEGELDRVILLLDAAATVGFAVPVKGTRHRMLEFCAALD
jgi:hypothetical protein